MTLLLTVLGAMLCSLMVSSQAQPQEDFDLQGIAGKWYLLGYATNAEWFAMIKTCMNMSTAVLTPTEEGNMVMEKLFLEADGSCSSVTNTHTQTDVPGKFKYTSIWGDKVMTWADVKYDEYALTYTTKNGDPNITTKLYARGVDLDEEIKEKFKQFSLDKDIELENIVFLPNNGECSVA